MQRLLIVADNSFAAQSIRLALRQTAGFQVIGYLDGTSELSPRVRDLAPDVVLIDDSFGTELCVARLTDAAALVPSAKRVVLTMHMEPKALDAMAAAGVDAVIAKTVHPVSLATLLREISRDSVIHFPRREPAKAERSDCPLTDRELEILRLVAQGHTNARIARELWVTEQTVKFHLSNTYRKLGVANRTEASRYAYVNDLMAAA